VLRIIRRLYAYDLNDNLFWGALSERSAADESEPSVEIPMLWASWPFPEDEEMVAGSHSIFSSSVDRRPAFDYEAFLNTSERLRAWHRKLPFPVYCWAFTVTGKF
jgi:hypothetical protein